ncbi:MAG: hypothetical protein IH870_00805 [Chloroflexi bacterium]|nr:hypothetical protein [Chloroflexota bacterium]
MIDKVNSKRPLVLMALLMLGMALMVVSANSAYATHDGGELPLTLPFTDGFGDPKDSNSNDVIHWDEIEREGHDEDCAVKNHKGDMALQLSNGCDAYVTFEVPYGASLVVEYDWGYHTTGGTHDDGRLEVRVVQLERSSETDALNIVSTGPTQIESFQPRQAQSNAGPIYTGRVDFDFLASTTEQLTTIIQVHFVGTSTGGRDWAWVDNVNITRDSPLPEHTVSWTQGYYHNDGEVLTCDVLAEMSRDPLAAMNVEAITGITTILASPSVDVDISASAEDFEEVTTPRDVTRLCFFLVGDQGGQDDCSFLTAGKLLDENGRCKPKSNLAAQDITLRLNLNLDLVYGEWGVDDDVEFRPIYLDYYLNIDPVPDPAGYIVYPLANTFGDEALGTCGTVDATIAGLCATGLAELTDLGGLVQRLDDAGTTVGDMLLAADALLLSGATVTTTHTINTVELTQLQITDILSLINKSYDEGIPTGVVTAWDYD